MEELFRFQLFVAVAMIIATAAYYRHYFKQSNRKIEATSLQEAQYFVPTEGGDDAEKRDFVEAMKKNGKRLIFFYGSQTGTSENYATRLAKEAKARYGLSSLVCNPQEYDFAVLDKVPEDSLVTFIISTYGEGEPTDNAVELVNFLKDEALELSDGGSTLPNLRFSVFCIGNSTYENFNTIGKLVDQRLEDIGATRIGICGIGDEDKALEEDYITWKDELWLAAETQMGWQNGVGVHSADFELNINPKLDAERIYLGELTESDLTGSRVGFQDPRMLFTSAVIKATDLFQDRERNCIFAEFDITASRMSYETGDHVGIWPVNSDADINRLLRILDLESKSDQVFDVKSLDPGLAKVPFPVPTTYSSVFRYYLDISQLTPRQTLEGFIKFAPTDRARAFLEKIGVDKDFYQKEIAEKCFNLGDVLLTAAGDSLDPTSSSYTHWNIPFERIISASSRLRPRYYSICSSPRMFPNSVHVAAVVMKDRPHADSKVVYGLTTNYLLNLKRAVSHEDIIRDPKQPIYSLEGP